jgi:hypothetical protein
MVATGRNATTTAAAVHDACASRQHVSRATNVYLRARALGKVALGDTRGPVEIDDPLTIEGPAALAMNVNSSAVSNLSSGR